MTLLVLLAAGLASTACIRSFDERSIVKDLRVLAVAADPPEVMVLVEGVEEVIEDLRARGDIAVAIAASDASNSTRLTSASSAAVTAATVPSWSDASRDAVPRPTSATINSVRPSLR